MNFRVISFLPAELVLLPVFCCKRIHIRRKRAWKPGGFFFSCSSQSYIFLFLFFFTGIEWRRALCRRGGVESADPTKLLQWKNAACCEKNLNCLCWYFVVTSCFTLLFLWENETFFFFFQRNHRRLHLLLCVCMFVLNFIHADQSTMNRINAQGIF